MGYGVTWLHFIMVVWMDGFAQRVLLAFVFEMAYIRWMDWSTLRWMDGWDGVS